MLSVELFAGAGGLAIGMAKAGFHHAAVIEWNADACETFRENKRHHTHHVEEWPLHEGDVRHFDYGTLGGDVMVVSGGPPCQPFSMGGKHRGHMDARDMFPEAVRAVRELRPKAFIFENVKGLKRDTFATYFEYIRLQFTYPSLQRRERERVFIVGFRADLGIGWSFPKPTHSEEALLRSKWITGHYWDRHKVAKKDRPDLEGRRAARVERLRRGQLFGEGQVPWLTVRDAISDLPDPESFPNNKVPNHRFNPGARSYQGHTGSRLDEPAKTLKAGDHGVPGGENMLARADGSVRYFTVREAARLQTFPDDYIFRGAWTEAMRQLGNAVPVRLAEVVAQSVARSLRPSAGEA
jgi:DNA (cytosine-5)-methyltransferase 1